MVNNVPYKSWNYTQDKPYPIYANNELPDDRCATALSLEIVISSPLVYCTKCLLIGHYHEDCPYFGECQICGDAASKEKESNDGITENGEDDYDDDNEDDHEEDKKDDVDGEDIDVVRSTTKNNEPYEYKFSDDDEEEGEEEEEEGEEEEGEGEENADNEAQEESVSHNFFMCPKTTKQDVIDVIKKVPPIVFFDEDGNFSPFSQMYEIECRKLWGSK
ncbi:unnamed protein product [[Candida] boidinii]|nr:unnamed protein product [[Candida] boidinii]